MKLLNEVYYGEYESSECRRKYRIEAEMPVRLHLTPTMFILGKSLNVTKTGLLVWTEKELLLNREFTMDIRLEEFKVTTLKVKAIRQVDNNRWGLQIVENNSVYLNEIESLKKFLFTNWEFEKDEAS
jgi:hypothetical protein